MKTQLVQFVGDTKFSYGEPSPWGCLPHNIRNYERKFGIIEIPV